MAERMSLLERAAEVRAKVKSASSAVENLRQAGDKEEWPAMYGAVDNAANDAEMALQSAWNRLDSLERIAVNALDRRQSAGRTK